MSREVKRVPLGFDWPMYETWWGYILKPVKCQTCHGIGTVSWPSRDDQKPVGSADVDEYWCPTCEGEGKAFPELEVPVGKGWQMWETTSEGSPISPVFATPEELARWLADNKASAFGDRTATYEQWLKMIVGSGTAPSAVYDSEVGELVSGVEDCSSENVTEKD